MTCVWRIADSEEIGNSRHTQEIGWRSARIRRLKKTCVSRKPNPG